MGETNKDDPFDKMLMEVDRLRAEKARHEGEGREWWNKLAREWGTVAHNLMKEANAKLAGRYSLKFVDLQPSQSAGLGGYLEITARTGHPHSDHPGTPYKLRFTLTDDGLVKATGTPVKVEPTSTPIDTPNIRIAIWTVMAEFAGAILRP